MEAQTTQTKGTVLKSLDEIWNQLSKEEKEVCNQLNNLADRAGEKEITIKLTVKQALTLAIRTKERVDQLDQELHAKDESSGARVMNRAIWGSVAAGRIIEQVEAKKQGRSYLKARTKARTYEDVLRTQKSNS